MDRVLFQGLLKTEDVALAFSAGWTQLDASRRSFHRDEGQENPGGLTSLGKPDGCWFLVGFCGFLCRLKPTGL